MPHKKHDALSAINERQNYTLWVRVLKSSPAHDAMFVGDISSWYVCLISIICPTPG
jgi:hypothetical protein